MCLLGGLSTLVLGLWPQTQLWHPTAALLASFIGYGGWLWALAAACLLVARALQPHPWRPVVAGLATVGLVIQLSWQVPNWVPNREAATGDPLTVVSINMYFDPRGAAAVMTRARDADVLVVLEASPDVINALRRQGITRELPHRIGDGAQGPNGTVVYSRYPITLEAMIPTGLESMITRVAAPGGEVIVAGVHPVRTTRATTARWDADARAVHEALRPYADGPLIVAGDFNAVDRHLTMQRLYALGLRNAADLAGSGGGPTWPVGYFTPTPVIAIDHVLVDESLTVTALTTFEAPGADHRGLVATVQRRA